MSSKAPSPMVDQVIPLAEPPITAVRSISSPSQIMKLSPTLIVGAGITVNMITSEESQPVAASPG